jgi:isocitrate dehydrogenase (NAD+)
MLSAIQMLRYIGERDAADRFETALFAVFTEGKTITKDLGGNAKTNEVARAIEEKILAGVSAAA